jgi:hypothetical protein
LHKLSLHVFTHLFPIKMQLSNQSQKFSKSFYFNITLKYTWSKHSKQNKGLQLDCQAHTDSCFILNIYAFMLLCFYPNIVIFMGIQR